MKTVFNMSLHESMTLKQQYQNIDILRVPGGWIYKFPRLNTTKAVVVKNTNEVAIENIPMVDQKIYDMPLHETIRIETGYDTIDVTKVPDGWIYHLDDVLENNTLFVEFDDEFKKPELSVAEDFMTRRIA